MARLYAVSYLFEKQPLIVRNIFFSIWTTATSSDSVLKCVARSLTLRLLVLIVNCSGKLHTRSLVKMNE